jgi:type IV secretion system protein VirB2
MPWEGPIQQVSDSITGPIAQFAAICAVVMLGGGVAVAEHGSVLRRGVLVVFGLSVMFAATTFFLDFFGFAGGVEIA